jgi:hypothetical protein
MFLAIISKLVETLFEFYLTLRLISKGFNESVALFIEFSIEIKCQKNNSLKTFQNSHKPNTRVMESSGLHRKL